MTKPMPKSGSAAYVCPHCGVLAQQEHFAKAEDLSGYYDDFNTNPVRVSRCFVCEKICLWHFDKMVYPDRGNAPPPHPDMPVEIGKSYEEAATIATRSPRAAAAILRLTIQNICKELGGKGDLNRDIAALVSAGLPQRVQQSLDVVRVIGNNAVHPGQIDTDDLEMVDKLFVLINLIVESTISLPAKVDALYDSLPESAREQIDKRDGR